MNENAYNRTEMLAKRVRDVLLYDMKANISLVLNSAYLMQAIIEGIDESCMNDDDLETFQQISQILIDSSNRILSSTETFREEVDIILKNKDYQ